MQQTLERFFGSDHFKIGLLALSLFNVISISYFAFLLFTNQPF